ncbi:peptidoglycan DD-metalloendopeptidase family protein [Candidatus Pelagibacter sp.]|nr:peptidoglycan DD-metalloendopeptidase family protein [Candidatus Pelagibacter sp.]
MKFIQLKIVPFFRKNIEILLLISLLIISIFITQLYNVNTKKLQKDYLEILRNSYFKKSVGYLFSNLKPKYEKIDYKIKTGDTLVSILNSLSVSKSEIQKIIKLLNKNEIKNLSQNLTIKLTLENTNDLKKVSNLLIPLSKSRKLEIFKDVKKDTFAKRDIITNLEKKIVLKEGVIKSSLYKSAIQEEISPNIIIEFARLYGFQVDFQRDIRKNDSFQIIYEIFVDENGKIFENGNIIYANLMLRGQYNQLYYFPKKNFDGHYDENGKSVKKALMKTPINGARLSSSFGMRKHPILGYNKMHRGTDFAAPEGTPIMASGDGVIIKAGWCGGGGNCVKIKHNKTYQTVYAHMKNFSNLAIPGNRIKQGQIIGYVGSTGMSTGPHLHYEVIENGKKINSQLLKLPPGKSLDGANRKYFEIVRIKTDVLKSDLVAKFN